jgi:hypothetical protein
MRCCAINTRSICATRIPAVGLRQFSSANYLALTPAVDRELRFTEALGASAEDASGTTRDATNAQQPRARADQRMPSVAMVRATFPWYCRHHPSLRSRATSQATIFRASRDG